MFRITVFFDGGVDEAEELCERIADLIQEHTRLAPDRSKVGYVVSMAAFDEPDDTESYVELVMQNAYMAFLGPAAADE
jgi:hypothetical protein